MRAGPEPMSALLDRESERAALDALLEDLRSGRGSALVVRGEAGVGKSALLEYAVGAAADMRVVRAAGLESEMELTYAGLHLLCVPLLDRLGTLPGPQRNALSVAFGLREGPAPARFLVGLAVLTLLAEAAEERPLLCVIDDVQWLDQASAQALGFAARRLLAEPVGLIFAAREPGEEYRGLTDLEVRGLPDQHARMLLRSVVRFRLDEPVQDRILAETKGNPLALLELPRELGPTHVGGGPGPAGTQAVPTRIERGFRRRVEALPVDTRSLMLVAAVEAAGDPALIWRAAGRLGVPASAAEAAEADGLLQAGTLVRFRHPLVRSAVYSAASPSERRAAHRALAEVTDRDRDPDRRVWHLAAAASGSDEGVAAELVRAADRAQARGAVAAAAAFLQRAVELTDEPVRRSERVLAAAQGSFHAGALGAAADLLARAEVEPLDELQQARAALLRGRLAFASGRGSDAPRLLLKAAKQLETLDVALARQTYLDAWFAALYAGRSAGAGDLHEVSRAARSAPAPAGEPRPLDLLVDGLSLLVTEGRAQAAPALRQAARVVAEDDIPQAERLQYSRVALAAAALVWDEEHWRAILARDVQICRETGMLTQLALYLGPMAVIAIWRGDLAAVVSLAAEENELATATGAGFVRHAALVLAGYRGDEAEDASTIEDVAAAALAAGQGNGVQMSQWISAVLLNGLGRYDAALEQARKAAETAPELYFSMWALPELIEAASRSGQTQVAMEALSRLTEATGIARTDWAQGIYARSQALVSEGEAAERLYEEAVDRLGRICFRSEQARAHLLYGEWLRGEGRRTDARTHLSKAHDMFTDIGMQAFTRRAARGLMATGAPARMQTPYTRGDLTPQEAQIARLARDGLSNPEIAAQLFISPKTVEYHLSKVFTKLNVSSRKHLGAVPLSHLDAS
ncbi:helix-turn-helix transcriptional regulator [Actinomadura nitritigenes]|uniref:helix-turn-helix transcriptional regulator n=1 Tax=Actinomadura nitritigenes TaxID=134602 RepID=UPI003D91AFFA